MREDYFQNWVNMAKGLQKPVQELLELNIKTLQNFSQFKPEALSRDNKPEQLFEKQVYLFIDNGHKTIDYLKKSFEIMENALSSLTENIKNVELANKEAYKSVENAVSKPVKEMTEAATDSTRATSNAVKSMLENTEKFDPLKQVNEMMKPAFDHNITNPDPEEQRLNATNKIKGLNEKLVKKSKGDNRLSDKKN